MQLTFEGRFETGNPLLDHDLRDLQLMSTDQGLFLCAINGVSGGVSVFRLTSDRSDLVDSKLYSSATLYGGSVCLWDGETPRLYLHGSAENRLSFYDLTPGGLLSDQYGYPVPGGAAGGLRGLVSTTLPGGQGVLYGISGSGQLQGWSLGNAGEAIATVGPAGTTHPAGALLAVAGGGCLWWPMMIWAAWPVTGSIPKPAG